MVWSVLSYLVTTERDREREKYISASSVNTGQMAGALLGGYCGGRFGPKKAMLASCLPAALGWIIIASSPHFAPLILGRVLCGLGVSLSFPNSPLLAAQYRCPEVS